jgi:hypothetical protein
MKLKLSMLALSVSLFSFKAISQSCTITCPQNLIVMADSTKEGAIVNFPKAATTGECGVVTYTPAAGTFFRIGSTTVTAQTASGQKCSFTVIVTDNESPSLSELKLSTDKLWPATNKMKKVKVFYTSRDNADSVKTKLSVTSNDKDGNDFEIVDDHQVRLKAARLSDGSPRVYYISVTSTDAAGNKTTRMTSIAVSKTMLAKPNP